MQHQETGPHLPRHQSPLGRHQSGGGGGDGLQHQPGGGPGHQGGGAGDHAGERGEGALSVSPVS